MLMYQKIKEEIKDIIQIVNECPDSLKEKCFEILLSNMLNENQGRKIKPLEQKEDNENKFGDLNQKTEPSIKAQNEIDEEISKKDLHVKTKKFLESESVSY